MYPTFYTHSIIWKHIYTYWKEKMQSKEINFNKFNFLKDFFRNLIYE